MRRYDLEPGEGIGFEILLDLIRGEPGIGRRDVVELSLCAKIINFVPNTMH
jgi:hypothetical protein